MGLELGLGEGERAKAVEEGERGPFALRGLRPVGLQPVGLPLKMVLAPPEELRGDTLYKASHGRHLQYFVSFVESCGVDEGHVCDLLKHARERMQTSFGILFGQSFPYCTG